MINLKPETQVKKVFFLFLNKHFIRREGLKEPKTATKKKKNERGKIWATFLLQSQAKIKDRGDENISYHIRQNSSLDNVIGHKISFSENMIYRTNSKRIQKSSSFNNNIFNGPMWRVHKALKWLNHTEGIPFPNYMFVTK